ncbi:O-methyltransferase [Rhodovulum sp. DZ06]|uniref:O-methyltransferase n=1 Tax=Rhodovulum sp. DZ06 TaxID=3425126 RepID=UPI003D34799A
MPAPVSPAAQAVLSRLHAEAAGDRARWEARTGAAPDPAGGGGGALVRLGEFYLGVSPEEGRFLHMIARATTARRIVEFGASFGISAIYLAEAARANGGALWTTEVHPDKCRALRAVFAEAGLEGVVTLLEGDARETLRDLPGPVDLLFLDGWKSAYLPVLKLMAPKLAPGALVLADNCFHEAAADYLEAVQDPDSDWLTSIQGDMAITLAPS